jgi:hypothetical protein
MALINTTTTGIQGTTIYADGTGSLTIQQNGATLGVFGNQPTFSAYYSGAQTISRQTFTKIQYNVEEWDTNNNYDNSTNYRFTPTVAGYYQISCRLQMAGAANSTTETFITIYKNGSGYKRLTSFGSTVNAQDSMYSSPGGSLLVYFNGTTDYIEAYVYYDSSTLATRATQAADTTLSYFQGILVRAA